MKMGLCCSFILFGVVFLEFISLNGFGTLMDAGNRD